MKKNFSISKNLLFLISCLKKFELHLKPLFLEKKLLNEICFLLLKNFKKFFKIFMEILYFRWMNSVLHFNGFLFIYFFCLFVKKSTNVVNICMEIAISWRFFLFMKIWINWWIILITNIIHMKMAVSSLKLYFFIHFMNVLIFSFFLHVLKLLRN